MVDSPEQIAEAVRLWIIHNHAFLKNLLKPYMDSREKMLEESPLFQEDIDREYFTLVRRIITEKAVESLNVDALNVALTVEELDLTAFLK